jgi:FkbM family methyltransferase
MIALQRAARGVAGVLGAHSPLVRRARPMYERTLAFLSGRRGIPWEINGAAFRISPFQRHRMGSTYDPEVARYLAAGIRPGATCVDIGANVGVYVLQLARWTGRSGRVIAFEPNPVSAAILAEHVRMNGFEDRVEIVQAAVAEASGTQTFHMADADGMSRLGAPNPELAGRTTPTTVRVTTLDEFCADRAIVPDWVLVDVEGFEFSVLAGARRTLAACAGRINIVVEMHPDAWAVAGWTRASAEALLAGLNLAAVSISELADPFASYGHVLLRPLERPAPDGRP